MSDLKLVQHLNRRVFLKSGGIGMGTMALGSLLSRDLPARADTPAKDIAAPRVPSAN